MIIDFKKANKLFSYDPINGKIYRRSNGKMAGTKRTDGYIRIIVNGKSYFAHRIAWLLTYGKFPFTGIDHWDGNPSNNRLDNLRSATQTINMQNTVRHSNNTSGIMGVSLYKATGKWSSYIEVNKKRIFLGYHRHLFDAACARKAAENKYGYHPNHGRLL